ncbi:MAG: hypothetical protein IJ390_12130 [Lachnospiraceae bacterium]|nr:hypothetical protein [Lachnospiraceae bacterium]
MAKRGYIFTDKVESGRGIWSSFLGALSFISLMVSVYLTFVNRGEAFVRYGVVALLCLIFSGVGLVLGLLARTEEDKFHLFAWLGIILNLLTLAGISFILYAGAYGL